MRLALDRLLTRHADNANQGLSTALPLGDEHGLDSDQRRWAESCRRALDVAELYERSSRQPRRGFSGEIQSE